MSIRITKTLGHYNLNSLNKEWQVHMSLPEDAPKRGIGQTWDEDDEPDTEGAPPSEVIEMISTRLESYWLSSQREQDRETIQWVRDNAKRLDAEWAAAEVEKKERQIDCLRREIASLREMEAQ